METPKIDDEDAAIIDEIAPETELDFNADLGDRWDFDDEYLEGGDREYLDGGGDYLADDE